MTHSADTESRLTNLEIKASFTEDLLDSLNQTIFRQQQQIDVLLNEVVRLRQQSSEAAGGGTGTGNELPPHY